MTTVAIVNGISKQIEACLNQLESLKDNVEIRVTTAIGDAEIFARDAADSGSELIIVCGGDGTLNEVVNGLMRSTNSECKIALYPIGSANDYSRMIGYASLNELILASKIDSIVNLDVISVKSKDVDRFFINVSAAGIGAEIAATVNKRRFKMNPSLNYYSAIISWLSTYKAPKIKIDIDGETFQDRCFLAAVGKGTYVGNGLGILPQVSPTDKQIGLTIAGNIGVIDFLRFQKNLKSASIIKDSRVKYMLGKTVRIEVLEGTLSIDTDGEYKARIRKGENVEYEVLPSMIKMVQSIDLRLKKE